MNEIKEADWNEIKAIYLEGIATKNATFPSNSFPLNFEATNCSIVTKDEHL